HDDLQAALTATVNLVDGVVSPESVHASERVVEDDGRVRAVGVQFQLREEKRQSQRRPVAATQRVPEARPAWWCLRVSEVNGIAVDDDLIAGARRAAAIGMRRLA